MRLVIGISGASGVIMGYELLKVLRATPEVETHLVITEGAKKTFSLETGISPTQAEALADFAYDSADFAAPIASGSFLTAGMVVMPCSMKTLAGITVGYAENLLLRAADVTLKEGRPLVLVPRETPLSKLHLRNLKEAADLGATILPPMLTFYNGADTVEKQINHLLGKTLRLLGLDMPGFKSWGE
ncbi:MAG: UbiX family flavin prenyltransferase [Selenomonadaceae bacterium]|nr:UbiX family flavin prenyltransferase [Selenomonadaceae bacterium]